MVQELISRRLRNLLMDHLSAASVLREIENEFEAETLELCEHGRGHVRQPHLHLCFAVGDEVRLVRARLRGTSLEPVDDSGNERIAAQVG